MLTLLGILFLFIIGGALGSWATADLLRSRAPAREQALRHELAGLRAAQRLGLAAWQARLQMQELHDEELRANRQDQP